MIHEQAPLAYLDHHAKWVIETARGQADILRSAVVTPEHLLLAVFAARQGPAERVVTDLAGSCARASGAISRVLMMGRRPSPAHIAFTATSEEALVQAARLARELGADQIDTGHLLLGALAVADAAAKEAMAGIGLTYAAVRDRLT